MAAVSKAELDAACAVISARVDQVDTEVENLSRSNGTLMTTITENIQGACARAMADHLAKKHGPLDEKVKHLEDLLSASGGKELLNDTVAAIREELLHNLREHRKEVMEENQEAMRKLYTPR